MSVPPPDLEAVMIHHGPFLRRLALSLVRNPADADDLVQDTLLAAATSHAEPIREPRAWLASVLRRRAASERRKLRPAGLGGHEDKLPARKAAQVEVAEHLERATLLQDALSELEEPYRTALYLRFHDNLRPKAIAERMDAPVKTVNSWLQRGLQKMRDQLDGAYGRGEEGRAAWLSGMALFATGGRSAAPPHSAGAAAATGGAAITWKGPLAAALAACLAAAVGAGIWWLQRPEPVDPASEPAAILASAVEANSTTAALVDPSSAPSTAGYPSARYAVPAAAATAEASTENEVQVELTVRNVDGEPAAAQSLVVIETGWRGTPAQVELKTTDANGKVTLQVDPSKHYSVRDLIGSNELELSDIHGGFEDAEAGSTLQAELALRPTITVSGRVLDASGAAQPGAVLYAMADGGQPPYWFPIGQADAAGHYEIQAGQMMTFQAIVPARLPSEAAATRNAPSGASGQLEVDLIVGAPGSVLTGRVVDEAGDPIQGATVIAGPLGRRSGSFDYTSIPSPVMAFTDAEGHFTYPAALAPGEQPIAVSAAGFATHLLTETIGAGPKNVSVTLDGGVTIEGRVVHADGSPAKQSMVFLTDPPLRWWRQFYGQKHGAYTDDEGRFQLLHVGASSGELRARHSNGSVTKGRLPWTLDSNAAPVEIVLGEGRVIAGRVVDEFGQPLEDVIVDAQCAFTRTEGLVTTDEEGRFRLTSLYYPEGWPEGADVRWTVSARADADGMRLAIGKIENVAYDTLDVEIVATLPQAPTAFIEGRVVNPDGPIPVNAILFLSHQTGQKLTGENNRGIDFDPATGVFRHGPLAAGTYGLSVYLPEVGEVASIAGIAVGTSDVVEVGDLRLDSGGTAALNVVVELPDIFPDGVLPGLIKDQRLELVSPYRRYEMVEAEGGWRTANPMPAGTYELQRRSGEILCLPRIPVTIVGGEHVELQVEALVGKPTMIWTLMDPAAEWESVELRFYKPSGDLVQVSDTEFRKDLNDEDKLRFLEAIPIGPIRIEVWIDGSASGNETSLEITGFTEPADPVTIDAR